LGSPLEAGCFRAWGCSEDNAWLIAEAMGETNSLSSLVIKPEKVEPPVREGTTGFDDGAEIGRDCGETGIASGLGNDDWDTG